MDKSQKEILKMMKKKKVHDYILPERFEPFDIETWDYALKPAYEGQKPVYPMLIIEHIGVYKYRIKPTKYEPEYGLFKGEDLSLLGSYLIGYLKRIENSHKNHDNSYMTKTPESFNLHKRTKVIFGLIPNGLV